MKSDIASLKAYSCTIKILQIELILGQSNVKCQNKTN
jgi:hypothetical protein